MAVRPLYYKRAEAARCRCAHGGCTAPLLLLTLTLTLLLTLTLPLPLTLDPTPDQDLFSGCPADDDALLFAVPVCAPYSTLASYTYRAKLTPGAQKKVIHIYVYMYIYIYMCVCSDLP